MSRELINKLLATLFTALLFFPIALESYHSSWHEHEPVDCEITQTHIHQSQLDCSLDDLQLSPFNYSLFIPDMKTPMVQTLDQPGVVKSRIYNTLHYSLRDRGPPPSGHSTV